MITQPQPNTQMPIGPRVKTYFAKLEQSGTNDPIATEYINTIGTITWQRLFQGQFVGNSDHLFPLGKTTILTSNWFNISVGFTLMNSTNPTDDNQIFLEMYAQDNTTLVDTMLCDILIQIFE